MVTGTRAAWVLAVIMGVALLGGCGMFRRSGLDLVADQRLHFAAPASHALVSVPVVVDWSMRGMGPGDSYAVFVDRAPIQPGQSLAAVAAGDAYCRHTAGCPNQAYLAQRGVYTSSAPHVSIPEIADLASNHDRIQLHTIVVVIMGPSGHRLGESAWTLDVRLRRAGTV